MNGQNNLQPDQVSPKMQPAGVFGLSVSAATRITQLLDSEPAGSFFRVAVLGGGCSGFQYDFSIDKNRQDDDLVFSTHNVEVVVDEMSLELIDHAELDYVQDLIGSYFAITNPNATASCGCGTSFSI
jgi:iron-sulfur cluster insertion protein